MNIRYLALACASGFSLIAMNPREAAAALEREQLERAMAESRALASQPRAPRVATEAEEKEQLQRAIELSLQDKPEVEFLKAIEESKESENMRRLLRDSQFEHEMQQALQKSAQEVAPQPEQQRNPSPSHNPIEPEPCSICFEETPMDYMLSCNHIFHQKCITQWAASKANAGEEAQCPICRARIDLSQAHKLEDVRKQHNAHDHKDEKAVVSQSASPHSPVIAVLVNAGAPSDPAEIERKLNILVALQALRDLMRSR